MSLFFELSIVISIAVSVAIVMRLLKQPLIISHIITGLIVGPFVLNFLHSYEIFNFFSELGIAILLFTVGLNLSPLVIKQFGKVSLVAALGQVTFTAVVGYLICLALGLAPLAATYVAIALSFSSTIIVLKLISDKNELESLYAKISIGFLLVQDVIALVLLFSIPLLSSPNSSTLAISLMFLKGLALGLLVWLVARYVLKPLNNFLAHSQELLFLFSLSWGFIIAAIFKLAGFSLETGALVAGVALATLPSRHEISARLVSMRDFFIVVFFIMLGAQMVLTGIWAIIPLALVLSLFVLIGNPLIMMIIMGLFGYRKKISLKTGLTVAQISEFSLILAALGFRLGHISATIVSLVTLVGLVTIFCSSYMILKADAIYAWLEPYLGIFERKKKDKAIVVRHRYPIVLFGCNRIGYDFVETFSQSAKKFLVVDYDPETVKKLSSAGIQTEYGDASDINFLESLELNKLELVVSTVPNLEANILITETIRRRNHKTTIMAVAHNIGDALELYDLGVDYVILPHFLGGRYAIDMLLKLGVKRQKFMHLKNKHLSYLQNKLLLGHEHPVLNRDRIY